MSSTSFVIKTRAQAAVFREKRNLAIQMYDSQLVTYAKEYMVSFDGSESLSDWSSRHASRFSLNVNGYIPLRVIKNDLYEYVTKNKLTKQNEKNVETATREATVSTQPLNAERKGRSQFNKILFSEFENWYSAFEAEADEDEGGASAASRWVYHCAKKLSRTGLSVESLTPVVEAWLNIHLKN